MKPTIKEQVTRYVNLETGSAISKADFPDFGSAEFIAEYTNQSAQPARPKQTPRAIARDRVVSALEALEENISDLERDNGVTPGEAVEHEVFLNLLREVRDGLYKVTLPEKNGRVRIELDFSKEVF